MSNLLNEFASSWKDYGIKHGLDSDSNCVEHAIRASVVVDDSKKPTVFDWKRYIKDHPDLQWAFGKGGPVCVNDATCHYLSHGLREGRKTFILGTNEPYVYDFDWKIYDKLNPDVFTQRHRTNVGEWHCFRHWCEYGYRENGRQSYIPELLVKDDAAISADVEVNKKWREALINVLKLRTFNSIKELVNVILSSYRPLVVMPTYNRAANIEHSIQMMLNQTYKNWTLLIIDDGSTVENKKIFKSIQDKYKENKNIIFMENETNKHIAFTLNKGFQHFLDNKKFTHFTWVSDDNEYYPDFLEKLYLPLKDFTYGWYDILYTTEKNKGKTATNKNKLGNLEILLERFNGCAAFLWSRKIVETIGIYTYSYPGCEDYEYLLRTFAELSMDKIEQVPMSLMKYVRHPESEFEKTRDKIIKYTNAIRKDFKEKLYAKKISIVMACYNRKSQTLETLKGFEQMYAGKYNFEVIIVDDNSNAENRLGEDIKQFTFPINLIVINAEEKGNRINSCIPYNKGFAEATGDIIIIQNPECLHMGDLLKYLIYNFKYDQYISFPCYNSNNFKVNEHIINNINTLNINNIENQTQDFNKDEKYGAVTMWYQHPTKWDRQLHFCCAIDKECLQMIDGFSSIYKDGICYEDDDILFKIKHILKLDVISLPLSFNIGTVHLYHGRSAGVNISPNETDLKKKGIYEKFCLNKGLFDLQILENKHISTPKIFHYYWDNFEKFSYMNLYSLRSAVYYHPDYIHIIWCPINPETNITWKEYCNKDFTSDSSWQTYLKEIINMKNVKLIYKDIGKTLNVENTMSEIHKSDLFRYYILHKYGGIWSDLDIVYIKSITDNINFEFDICCIFFIIKKLK